MSQQQTERSPAAGPSGAPRRSLDVLDALLALSTFALLASVPVEDVVRGPLSLSRLVGIPVVAIFGLWCITRARLRYDSTAAVGLLAFVTWAVLSYFWSVAPGATIRYLSTFLQLMILVLVIWQVCSTAARLRMALGSLAVGGAAGAILSLADQVVPAGGVPRYAVGDPNDFGVGLAITLVCSLHIARTTQRNWVRLLWAVLAVLQAVAVLRTASRTALIALILGLLVSAADRRLMQPRVLLGTLAALAATIFLATRFTSALAFSRLSSTYDEASSGDFTNRGQVWSLAFSYWSEVPFHGLGGAGYRVRAAEDGYGRAVHSVGVGLLTELGVIGLSLFVLVLVIALRRVFASPDPVARRTLIAAGVCWLIGSLTLTLEIRKMIWILVALATCEGLKHALPSLPRHAALDQGEVGSPRGTS